MQDHFRNHSVTAAEALTQHGYTWDALEKLARRALNDEMRSRRVILDADRLQEAVDHLTEVGARWALRYDPDLARGVSFTTSCYRRMRPRLADYLRARRGDERRGTPLDQIPVATFADTPARLDPETVEQLSEHVSGSLTTRALWTLRHIAGALAVDGSSLGHIAQRLGLERDYAAELLEELGHQLGHSTPEHADDPSLLTVFLTA